MSEQSKKIILVVASALVASGLAIAGGAVLLRGHGAHRLSYQQAAGPHYADPTVFAAVAGKATHGVDVPKLFKSTPGALARGKQLFGTNCAACHGAAGKGNGPAAASLHPAPRNFTSPKGWTRGYTIADIYTTLSEGVQGTAMPSFDTLSPRDRFALVHYVQSLGRFDHHDSQTDEIAGLDAKYHLSATSHAPNKVAVAVAMKDMAAGYAAPAAVRIPDASDTSPGARLCRRLIADPVRAAAVLSQVPDWRTKTSALSRVAMAGTPENGFQPAVATLDDKQWQAFHDTLVEQTPVPAASRALAARELSAGH